MKLFFVTPERKIVVDQEILEVTLPAHLGELNILPGHAPLMTRLTSGPMKIKLASGEVSNHVIAWGYCQVSAAGVSVLAEKVWEQSAASDELRNELKQIEELMSREILDDKAFEDLEQKYQELIARTH